MKKTLVQKLGLLGVVSLLSYTAAVVFSPLAYPGYDWLSQAVKRSERGQRAVSGAVEPAEQPV